MADKGHERLKTGRLGRSAPVVGLAARAAVGRVGASLRRRLGDDDAIVQFHERNALRIVESLSGSKGLLMKAGQLLSFVQPPGLDGAEHWSPYQDALAALRTNADPMPSELVQAVVESELGSPTDELFRSFDPEPMAAASIGQVHHAERLDGQPVAVKVQYPGAAEAIGADLANTELLATMLKLAQSTLPRMPQVDSRALAVELGERLSEELDYTTERANLEEFARIYADQPAIRIPATHPELSTSRVLTMDLVEGLRWEEALHAPQDLRNQWGDAINRFFFRSIYRAGIFHGDPHPGNYVFHDDGSVTILDFGCVSRLDDDTLAGFVAIAEATTTGDAERLASVFQGYGFVTDETIAAEELLAFYRPTFECMIAPQPYKMTAAFTNGVIETLNPYGDAGRISRKFNLPPPFLLTARIYIGLFSVLAALEAEADWVTPYQDDLRYYHDHRAARAATNGNLA